MAVVDVVEAVDDLEVAMEVSQGHLPPLASLKVEDMGGGAQAGEDGVLLPDLDMESRVVAIEGEACSSARWTRLSGIRTAWLSSSTSASASRKRSRARP